MPTYLSNVILPPDDANPPSKTHAVPLMHAPSIDTFRGVPRKVVHLAGTYYSKAHHGVVSHTMKIDVGTYHILGGKPFGAIYRNLLTQSDRYSRRNGIPNRGVKFLLSVISKTTISLLQSFAPISTVA